MTALRKEMIDWIIRSGFSPRTVESCVKAAVKFAQHYWKSPVLLTEQDIVAYNYLFQDRQLSQSFLNCAYSGIKVLWENVLGRSWPNRLLPRTRRAKNLPEVLSRAEVQDILNALDNTKHRVMLRMMYTTGLRVGELVELKPPTTHSHSSSKGQGKKRSLCPAVRTVVGRPATLLDDLSTSPSQPRNIIYLCFIPWHYRKKGKKLPYSTTWLWQGH